MLLPSLEPDCSTCAALCCVALAFDEGEDFAFDKPAGLPCPHLAQHECSIYNHLEEEGFSGCLRYDCLGAGQRTVALHDGISWQDAPGDLPAVLETFRHLRWIHQQLDLLQTTAALPLEDDEDAARAAFVVALCPDEMTPDRAAALATGSLRTEIARFLRSLAHHI